MSDENGDDYMSVSIYSQKRKPIQSQLKPTAWLLPRTDTEESKLKSKLKSKNINIFLYCLKIHPIQL
jgi:hypothetical protein